MIHEQIREARIRAGLSQNQLSKLAKVPRAQLRKFEEGGNVTLATVEKLLAHLPGLQLSLTRRTEDVDAMRKALVELLKATQRVMDLLIIQPAQAKLEAPRQPTAPSPPPSLPSFPTAADVEKMKEQERMSKELAARLEQARRARAGTDVK